MTALTSALQLSKSITLKNRIVMPPMVNYQATEEGQATKFHEIHYGARALGGVGLIIVEATAVNKAGRLSFGDLGLWDDNQIAGHQKIVDTCHEFNSIIAVQLAHAGRKTPPDVAQSVAPSPLQFSKDYNLPKELNIEEIKELQTDFVHAALRAEKAGYDLIELHAAHGYLINSFLSPLSNQRTDAYGGSFENRMRFLGEIIDLIKKHSQIPIGLRISASEWTTGGWDIQDSVKLTKQLEGKIAYIHVSAGGNQAKPDLMPEIKALYQIPYAAQIKKESNIPVIGVGNITSIDEGNRILTENSCDLVAYGRELTRNPNLPQFVAQEMRQTQKIHPSYVRSFSNKHQK